MPLQPVGRSQCEVPDASASDPLDQTLNELEENLVHDVVEAACEEARFIPDSWCDAAGKAADHVVDEISDAQAPTVPPEHAWNLESS